MEKIEFTLQNAGTSEASEKDQNGVNSLNLKLSEQTQETKGQGEGGGAGLTGGGDSGVWREQEGISRGFTN